MTHDLTPVARAIRAFGSQSTIAAILGIKQPSVAGWKDGVIPAQHIPTLISAAKARGIEIDAETLLPAPAQAA